MTRLAVILVSLAALASVGQASAARPLAVLTSIAPEPVFFADRVTARVDVIADRRQIDAGSIQVDPSFGDWSQADLTRSASTESSTIVRRTWWYTIECLTLPCVPKGMSVQSFRLPPVKVTARTRGGESVEVHKAWPTLGVSGRFPPPPNTDVTPLFKLSTTIPPATYRVSPSPVALALDIAGGLAIALAIYLAGFKQWWARRHRSVVAGSTPLARALTLVRDAQTRAVDDRRRAAGLLARSLPLEADDLTSDASRIAWSMPEPTPATLEELARTVEDEVEQPG